MAVNRIDSGKRFVGCNDRENKNQEGKSQLVHNASGHIYFTAAGRLGWGP